MISFYVYLHITKGFIFPFLCQKCTIFPNCQSLNFSSILKLYCQRRKSFNLFKNLQIELREEATLPSRPPGFFVQSERMVEKATIFERDGKERKMAQLTSI